MQKMELDMIRIVLDAHESSNSLVHQNVNRESFNGIIIETYCGSIFCHKIITLFGSIRVSNSCMDKEIKKIDDYIKSRITYREILPKTDTKYSGVLGPFYLVTHIDGVPVPHDDVDGITYDTFYKYVKLNPEGREQYPAFIEDCIKRRLLRDKNGVLEKLILDPETYPSIVKELTDSDYLALMDYNMYFHVWGLLNRKQLL